MSAEFDDIFNAYEDEFREYALATSEQLEGLCARSLDLLERIVPVHEKTYTRRCEQGRISLSVISVGEQEQANHRLVIEVIGKVDVTETEEYLTRFVFNTDAALVAQEMYIDPTTGEKYGAQKSLEVCQMILNEADLGRDELNIVRYLSLFSSAKVGNHQEQATRLNQQEYLSLVYNQTRKCIAARGDETRSVTSINETFAVNDGFLEVTNHYVDNPGSNEGTYSVPHLLIVHQDIKGEPTITFELTFDGNYICYENGNNDPVALKGPYNPYDYYPRANRVQRLMKYLDEIDKAREKPMVHNAKIDENIKKCEELMDDEDWSIIADKSDQEQYGSAEVCKELSKQFELRYHLLKPCYEENDIAKPISFSKFPLKDPEIFVLLEKDGEEMPDEQESLIRITPGRDVAVTYLDVIPSTSFLDNDELYFGPHLLYTISLNSDLEQLPSGDYFCVTPLRNAIPAETFQPGALN